MKILTIILSTFVFSISMADQSIDHSHHDDHEGHIHEQMVDGKHLEVDAIRFDNFIIDLSDTQIAVVSVKGMVCDFCARGIEKTFKKDRDVRKIDVDLRGGKVLIAYDKNKQISFDEIRKMILANGQDATDLQVLSI